MAPEVDRADRYSIRLSVSVSAGLFDAVWAEAESQDLSMSHVARLAIQRGLGVDRDGNPVAPAPRPEVTP
jgi:hypothetical protein